MIKDAQKSAILRKRDFSPALFVGVLTIITAFSGLLPSSPRASAGTSISAYSEDFNSDGLRPGSNDDIVYLGLTVRCVADWSERERNYVIIGGKNGIK